LSGLVTAAGGDILIYKNDTKSGWRYGRYWSCTEGAQNIHAKDLNFGRQGDKWLSDDMNNNKINNTDKISVTDTDIKTSARCIRLVINTGDYTAPQ